MVLFIGGFLSSEDFRPPTPRYTLARRGPKAPLRSRGPPAAARPRRRCFTGSHARGRFRCARASGPGAATPPPPADDRQFDEEDDGRGFDHRADDGWHLVWL